jgi:hypothetical protein
MGLAWTPDSRDIVMALVSGGRHLAPVGGVDLGRSRLGRWRVGDTRSTPRLVDPAEGAMYPTTARLGQRLVFAQFAYESDFWMLRDGVATPHRVSSTRDEFGPQFSPDGTRVTFYSSRSGQFQVWIANVDASGLTRIEFGGPAGLPRWSPDGTWIVFQGYDQHGQADIYRARTDGVGGAPIRLTEDPADDFAPSVSQDGRHVYFTSNRTGQTELFRMDVDGRDVTRLTTTGGDVALELPGGRGLVYQQPTDASTSADLWLLPADGGSPKPLGIAAPLGAFTLAAEGVSFVQWSEGGSTLAFYDFVSKQTEVRHRLEGRVEDIAESPDRRTWLVSRIVREQSDLMLLDGFK